MKLKKRIAALLMAGAMVCSTLPVNVLAVENSNQNVGGLCEHHTEHNADCGYTEGIEGTPCNHEHNEDCYALVTSCVHEHDEDCYPEESDSDDEATPSNAQKREPENCPHICDEESGCITEKLNCQHEHDDECGYSPATAGTPCGYVCELCGAGDNTPSNAEAVTVASVQAMIDALPNVEEITEDNAEDVKAQLDAIDEAKEKLSDEEIDELDFTRYAEAAAALGALAAPMLLADDSPDEQFSLTPGGRYYFDLSGKKIPGTANGSLPDSTLHYVPFTYVGTINAYSRNSEGVSTDDTVKPYAHSLFVADYNVTHTVSWNDLNRKSLIFGKDYVAGGVDYTLRAPSAGSNRTGSGDSKRGVPQSNEWDTMLNKNSGYIQNWDGRISWGQDTFSDNASLRANRGYLSARGWYGDSSSYRGVGLGFRPVLEVLKPDTLGSDGLKVVTLDLGGGTLGGSSDAIQIIVKTGSTFTAPASDGLTRPDGDTGSYFVWLGSDGKLYAPGDNVPAEVTTLTVQWTASTYTVTLNTNGGTIADGKDVTGYTYGVGATLPTDVTRTGYTFKGWYDNENLTGSPVTAISNTETGNKEYWAKWEINQYTITVKPENGKADITITQDYGTAVAAPADPTREGYTFMGWNPAIPATMPAENLTITAQWAVNRYTLTFDTDGGSEVAPITQDYGTTITAPEAPTKPGYTFKGWDKEIPATMPAENLTVTAQWTVNQYTVTFDTAGGSEVAPITQDYGTTVTAPEAPTKPGYTFKGWDKEIPATMPAENLTLTAQWTINQYTITFDTDGGSEIAPITQDYGTAVTAPADPTREGYTFTGWDKAIPETMPAENMTITAQWAVNQYTITFDTDGGSEVAPITQDYGTTITAPEAPTKPGYTFKGWDKEIPATMPAENLTLTAQWTINQYTISFDTDGGSAIDPITQDYGTTINAPAAPTKTGYTFIGWSPALPATMPAENLTVTAKWTIDQYTITYDLDGGTAEGNPDTYTVETDAFTLKNPTRPGYTFTGWSGTGLDGENNMTVTIPTGSTGNRTYTAHWRYNGGGGSGYSYYTIKATAGAGGSISPSGNVSVREGRDQTFTITPDKGYAVANVKIDGKSIGAVKSYTFENVSRPHTIEVIFMKANGNPQTGVFVDVATGSYYEDAVDWAVENGITKGTDDTHFSPDGICTRAQAVTFLWRTAGSPEPETRAMPFTDVPVGSYYYDAVLWAVESGITKGTSETTFSPDATCSRAQIVTFLWRSEKSPAAGTANPFADVKSTAYYADAVLWAVKENITKGTTSTTFSPNADCTRAQIVTFLWRCKK